MTLVCSHQLSLSSFTFTATEDWGEKEIFCNKKASVGEKEGEGRGSGNRNYLLFPVHSPLPSILTLNQTLAVEFMIASL